MCSTPRLRTLPTLLLVALTVGVVPATSALAAGGGPASATEPATPPAATAWPAPDEVLRQAAADPDVRRAAAPSTPASTTGWRWPVDADVTSGFGNRVHPISGAVKLHAGLDLPAAAGTPVVAAADGTVTSAGWQGGYGITVVIDHGDGLTSLYAHLSAVAVTAGQVVAAGDVVGAVGSTGASTGPHLHLEARLDGTPVDPTGHLAARSGR